MSTFLFFFRSQHHSVSLVCIQTWLSHLTGLTLKKSPNVYCMTSYTADCHSSKHHYQMPGMTDMFLTCIMHYCTVGLYASLCLLEVNRPFHWQATDIFKWPLPKCVEVCHPLNDSHWALLFPTCDMDKCLFHWWLLHLSLIFPHFSNRAYNLHNFPKLYSCSARDGT